jgi:hypothetical protein
LIDAVTAERNVETSSGCRNPFGFGGGDEVADLTESQSHKKFRRFFEFYNCLLRRKKSGTSFVGV